MSGSDDEGKKPVVIRNTIDLQRLKLEKLMKNPDKPIIIPDRPKERGMPAVPDFVRNVMGSSAGAGSGEFHVYRHLRRKEYARQKYMKEKGERERLENEYHEKLEENKRQAEQRTAKKRAKRLKKKKNQKRKRPDRKKDESTSTENSETEDESCEEKSDTKDTNESKPEGSDLQNDECCEEKTDVEGNNDNKVENVEERLQSTDMVLENKKRSDKDLLEHTENSEEV